MSVSSIPETPTQVNSSPLKVLINSSLSRGRLALLNSIHDHGNGYTTTEFAILVILVEDLNKFVPREKIANRLWGSDWETANNLHQYINRLRNRIPNWIQIDTWSRARKAGGSYRLRLTSPRGEVTHLTRDQQRERREYGLALRAQGKSKREIARLLSVHPTLIRKWEIRQQKGRQA